MLLDKTTLKTRLILAVLTPCSALLIIAVMSLNTMTQIQGKTESIYLGTADPMRSMAEVTSRIPRMRVGIDMMLLQQTEYLQDSKGVKTRVKEAREEDIPELITSLEHALSTQVDPQMQRDVRSLKSAAEKMINQELTPMLKAFESGDMATASQIYRDKYANSYGTLRKQADQILDRLLVEAKTHHQQSEQTTASAKYAIYTAITFGLLLSILISFVVINGLRKKVETLKRSMNQAAQNLSLDVRLDVSSNDELSDVGRSFNTLMERMHQSFTEVASSSFKMSEAADKVAQQAQHTQRICVSQRDRTTQVATAINQLGATVAEISSNAANAADVALEAKEGANTGVREVLNAKNNIDNLSNGLDNTKMVVSSLAQQVNDISSILETIRSISDQTNLLALNAAIEAARAGEQGRGFAVVADEVRNLASRTKSSTEEIESALTSLLKGNQSVVDSMSVTKDRCQQAADGAGQVAVSLDIMTDIVSEINDLSTQVAAAAEEQSSVTQEVSKNMTAINNIVGELDKNGKQVVEEINSIDGINHQLTDIISRFKI